MEDKKSPHFQSDLFSSEMLGQLKSGFESPKSQRFMYKKSECDIPITSPNSSIAKFGALYKLSQSKIAMRKFARKVKGESSIDISDIGSPVTKKTS